MKNNRGLSLVESMIAIGILTVAIAGSVSAFSSFQKYIVLSRAKTTLVNMRNEVLERMRGDKSWERSIRLSGMNCLWDGSDCNGAAFNLTLCREDENDVANCITDADRVSIEGVRGCAGDNMQCPFTVQLTAPNTCVAANCQPTSVAINFGITVTPEFTATYGALETAKYAILFNRNLGTLNEAFSAVEVIGNVNSGSCGVAGGAWVQRSLTRFLNNADTNATIAGGDLVLVPGRYKCDVNVPAYAVNSFRIKVRDTASGWESVHGTGFALRTAANAGVQASATTSFDQTFAAAATLRILFMAERCAAIEVNSKGLKVPLVGGVAYNETPLSVITCTRVF